MPVAGAMRDLTKIEQCCWFKLEGAEGIQSWAKGELLIAFFTQKCWFMLQPLTQVKYSNSAMEFSPDLKIKFPYCSSITPLNSFKNNLVLNTPGSKHYHWSEMNMTLHGFIFGWNENETGQQSQGLWLLRSTWGGVYSTPPAGCQHWTATALPTYLSISHPQPAVVSILERTWSHEVDILSKGHKGGEAAFTIFLCKGVTLMNIDLLVPLHFQ